MQTKKKNNFLIQTHQLIEILRSFIKLLKLYFSKHEPQLELDH
jgi:hypothetical protein